MEKRYKLISDKYSGLLIANVYQESEVINEDGEQVMDFVTLFPNHWQEMNKENEPNELVEILKKIEMEKKKIKVIDIGLGTRYSEVFKETKMRIDFTFNSEVKGSLELRNFLALKLEEFFNGTTK